MSVVRRLAVVTLAVTLFATGTALAGRYDPRRELIPADQARAAAMLPRTADLGRGYKPDTSPTTWTSRTCAGIDESGLTLTGERFAPVWISSTSIVVAVARLYESRRRRRQVVAPRVRPVRCRVSLGSVGRHARHGVAPGVPVSRVPHRRLPDPLHAVRRRHTLRRRCDRDPARSRTRHVHRRHVGEVASVPRARDPTRPHRRRPPGEGDARRIAAPQARPSPPPNRADAQRVALSGPVHIGP